MDGTWYVENSQNDLFFQNDFVYSFRFKETAVAGDSSVGETLDGDIMVWGFIGGRFYSAGVAFDCTVFYVDW